MFMGSRGQELGHLDTGASGSRLLQGVWDLGHSDSVAGARESASQTISFLARVAAAPADCKPAGGTASPAASEDPDLSPKTAPRCQQAKEEEAWPFGVHPQKRCRITSTIVSVWVRQSQEPIQVQGVGTQTLRLSRRSVKSFVVTF